MRSTQGPRVQLRSDLYSSPLNNVSRHSFDSFKPCTSQTTGENQPSYRRLPRREEAREGRSSLTFSTNMENVASSEETVLFNSAASGFTKGQFDSFFSGFNFPSKVFLSSTIHLRSMFSSIPSHFLKHHRIHQNKH